MRRKTNRKILDLLKFYIRRFRMRWLYKHNYNTGKLIGLSREQDRCLGCSTLLMKDSLEYNIPIVVYTRNAKLYFADEMAHMARKKNMRLTYKWIRDNLLISVAEIKTGYIRGRIFQNGVLIDNAVDAHNVNSIKDILAQKNIKIVNGFFTRGDTHESE